MPRTLTASPRDRSYWRKLLRLTPVTNIYGVVGTHNIGGGAPQRGTLQSTLEYLLSLGSETVLDDDLVAEHRPEGAV